MGCSEWNRSVYSCVFSEAELRDQRAKLRSLNTRVTIYIGLLDRQFSSSPVTPNRKVPYSDLSLLAIDSQTV